MVYVCFHLIEVTQLALINFWQQKNYLNGLQADLSGLTAYANALNSCAASINACWDGNTDKQYIFSAIGRQIQAVNRLRQDVNWVQHVANFVLEKLNELGRLEGCSQPYVAQVSAIGMSTGCSAQTKIKLDTNRVRAAATILNSRRSSLAESKNNLARATNVMDIFILGIWTIGAKIIIANKQVDELLVRHDRIVQALNRCADTYDAADRRLVQRAGGSIGSSISTSPYLVWLKTIRVGGKDSARLLTILLNILLMRNRSISSDASGGDSLGLWGTLDVTSPFYRLANADNAKDRSMAVLDGVGKPLELAGTISELVGDKTAFGPGVSIVGSVFTLVGTGTEALDREGKSGLESVADWTNFVGSGGKLGLNIHGAVGVKAAGKSVTSKLAPALILDSGFSTVAQFVRSYDTYGQDGSVDGMDTGRIMMDGSLIGLNKLFLGLFSDEAVLNQSQKMQGSIERYGQNIVYPCISSNPTLKRMYDEGGIYQATSKILAINIANTDIAINFIGNATSTAGGWIKSGWTKIFGE